MGEKFRHLHITPRMIIYCIIKDCGVPTCQEREDKRGHPTGQGRKGGNCTVKVVAVVVVAYDDDQRWNLPVDIVGDSCSLLETTSLVIQSRSSYLLHIFTLFVMIQGVQNNTKTSYFRFFSSEFLIFQSRKQLYSHKCLSIFLSVCL